MADKVRVYFDVEGDFLEVLFCDEAGFMRQTENDAVMERVDKSGKILGFSILQVSKLSRTKPLCAQLT
jgi:hypothetical protein